MRQQKKPLFKSKPQCAIVVDGQCESWYIQMLKKNEPGIGFGLKPELPHRKTLTEQYKQVIDLANHYDKVFWIIDCDVIAGETLLAKKGTETAQQLLEKYIKHVAKAKAYKGRIFIIRNNPCLEYWLLLHFEETTAPFNSCDDAGKRLKKHITLYEKTEAFYKKENNDIYLQLKPHLAKAAKRAEHIATQTVGNMTASISQMHLLFAELGLYEKKKASNKKAGPNKR